MDARERALARSRGYALIGDLFRRGLREDSLAAWCQVPAVAPQLPRAWSADEAAAAHERVMTEVFPYESVFLGPEGLMGGDVAADVRRSRREAGLDDPRDAEADRLGEELAVLAFLGAAEADELRPHALPPSGGGSGRGAIEHIHLHQRRFLDGHLLRWLPTATVALGGLGSEDARPDGLGLYRSAGAILLDLAVAHRLDLGGTPEPWALPETRSPETLLAEPSTGLARVARHLCIPSRAGGFLSLSALARVGRDLDLPRGFGKRWQVLESLLHAAAHFDAVSPTLAALDAEFSRFEDCYSDVADRGMGALVAPWRARVAASRRLLDQMACAFPAGPTA